MHLDRTLVQRPSLRRVLVHLAVVFAFALQVAPLLAAPAPAPGVVNINTASAAELALLPRVGPALAERMLTFRKENGEWKKTSDVILVRGIGEKTFRLLEPFIVTEGKTTLTRKLRTADVESALAAKEAARGGDKPQEAKQAGSGQRD